MTFNKEKKWDLVWNEQHTWDTNGMTIEKQQRKRK